MRVDQGFQELYRMEFATVFRAVLLLCGDRGVAEEATQEAFARALERWRRLRDRPWAPGWVTTTALNVARRMLRRRPVASEAGRATPDLDEGIDLWLAVRRLPARQQEAVALRYVLDLPVAEVARAMELEEGTAKAHLARARDALRRELAEVNDER